MIGEKYWRFAVGPSADGALSLFYDIFTMSREYY